MKTERVNNKVFFAQRAVDDKLRRWYKNAKKKWFKYNNFSSSNFPLPTEVWRSAVSGHVLDYIRNSQAQNMQIVVMGNVYYVLSANIPVKIW